MAKSQMIQPFLLLLLLVPLFSLPLLVRSVVEFQNCTPSHGADRNVIKVNDVEIDPDSYELADRNGTFFIIADTLAPLKPEEAIIHLFQTLNSVPYEKTYKLCDVTACPVNFTFTDTFSAAPDTYPLTEDFQIVIERYAERMVGTFMCVEFRLWPNDHYDEPTFSA